MGFAFGPFDITGSLVTLTGSLNTTGSINLTGSITSTTNKYTLTFTDMSISHVSGTRDFYAGVGTAFTALPFGFGSGNDGSRIILYPTASSGAKYSTFTTIPKNAKITRYTIYTNAVVADLPDFNGNDNQTTIYTSIGTAYLAPSSTSQQNETVKLLTMNPGTYSPLADIWSIASTGSVLNSPVEILDDSTFYITGSCNINIAPTEYSPTYFTFLMSIGSQFPTKTYKFRVELEIEDSGYPIF